MEKNPMMSISLFSVFLDGLKSTKIKNISTDEITKILNHVCILSYAEKFVEQVGISFLVNLFKREEEMIAFDAMRTFLSLIDHRSLIQKIKIVICSTSNCTDVHDGEVDEKAMYRILKTAFSHEIISIEKNLEDVFSFVLAFIQLSPSTVFKLFHHAMISIAPSSNEVFPYSQIIQFIRNPISPKVSEKIFKILDILMNYAKTFELSFELLSCWYYSGIQKVLQKSPIISNIQLHITEISHLLDSHSLIESCVSRGGAKGGIQICPLSGQRFWINTILRVFERDAMDEIWYCKRKSHKQILSSMEERVTTELDKEIDCIEKEISQQQFDLDIVDKTRTHSMKKELNKKKSNRKNLRIARRVTDNGLISTTLQLVKRFMEHKSIYFGKSMEHDVRPFALRVLKKILEDILSGSMLVVNSVSKEEIEKKILDIWAKTKYSKSPLSVISHTSCQSSTTISSCPSSVILTPINLARKRFIFKSPYTSSQNNYKLSTFNNLKEDPQSVESKKQDNISVNDRQLNKLSTFNNLKEDPQSVESKKQDNISVNDRQLNQSSKIIFPNEVSNHQSKSVLMLMKELRKETPTEIEKKCSALMLMKESKKKEQDCYYCELSYEGKCTDCLQKNTLSYEGKCNYHQIKKNIFLSQNKENSLNNIRCNYCELDYTGECKDCRQKKKLSSTQKRTPKRQPLL